MKITNIYRNTLPTSISTETGSIRTLKNPRATAMKSPIIGVQHNSAAGIPQRLMRSSQRCSLSGLMRRYFSRCVTLPA